MSRALSTPQRDAAQAIGWYPGHMAAAMRRLADDMRVIDAVLEIADARVPLTGTNPALARVAGSRPHLLVLSRAQLADQALTKAWLAFYAARHVQAVAVDAKSGAGVAHLRAALQTLTGDGKPARAIVLGIPNAGKSTAINALAGRNVARTEDRAGVTRARQWFRVGSLEIMDTAGVLPPKIDDAEHQWKLALVGALPRARFDPEDVVARFCRWYAQTHDEGATKRAVPDLATFTQSRGFMRRGTIPDVHNAAWAYLRDWGDGKLGPMTLESPAALEATS
ncbi:MAG: ribosome biogenesis GTPase YlqF [Candidatus Eremiobacteraeota bacterium]|nr:ribosome biogenesis GTPase YlqF [Candidatus Eremiobacteraeota bacterium]MBC5803047.1 ribosome biogenesis GTPase YlqF [Candidatus Eremiobacteraeota bacterium]MBC5821416.1 ribosome biogenesis GTPase YlqF [Candidatus Eremiobacteraeota bacterium]